MFNSALNKSFGIIKQQCNIQFTHKAQVHAFLDRNYTFTRNCPYHKVLHLHHMLVELLCILSYPRQKYHFNFSCDHFLWP